jgi:hypothetical protein
LKPRPGTGVFAGRVLQRPHVVQRGSRIFTESPVPSVMVGKDQGIEDGFGPARLGDFLIAIAVVRSDLFPEAYTLRDIVKKPALVDVMVVDQ